VTDAIHKVAVPHREFKLGPVFYILLLAIVGFFVLFPLSTLVSSSFQVGIFGRATHFGFDNWLEPFHSERLAAAIWNTLSLSLTRQVISLAAGILIAWLIARTNLPGRQWIEIGFWIALFMPALPVAMSWVLLAGGRNGILNVWVRDLLPFVKGPLFNIYSWWGIVWVHLMTSTIPLKVFLLTPAFRNMDAALEDCARTCGTGLLRTLWRVVIPILLPSILVVTLLGMIRAMQAFEIELMLGTPAGIDVYSTVIYRAMKQEPPLYGVGSVLSLIFMALLIPFIMLQQWVVHRHSHAVVGGRFSARVQDIGIWRWPIFVALVLLLMLMTVLPTVMLTVGSFMKLFGVFNLPQIWTTRHWELALSRSDLLHSLANTLELGFASALLAMTVYSVVAYAIVKARHVGRQVLDLLTWLPTMIPGIVISLGFLQMFLETRALRPLYGTVGALILAVWVGNMTVGVQVIRGTLLQLSAELEEASWTSGASRLRTFFKIIFPLVAPSVIVVGLQVFATAVSAISLIVLLSSGPNQPLSLLQLSFLEAGQFEAATIVGLLVLVITMAAAVLTRLISARFGVERV
jgi:iron(III) transport system permease protein